MPRNGTQKCTPLVGGARATGPARASRPAPLAIEDLPPVERTEVKGPAVAAEDDCTVWVPEGWMATPGPLGAWIVTPS